MAPKIPLKLILGIKLKHYRLNAGYSLKKLSEESKISHSYLNEIEKGKKFPKPDKLMAIAEALNITYDDLVSTSFDSELEPIEKYFKSNFFKSFPFEFFEIDPSQLVQSILGSPLKLSTLFNTLNKLSGNYNIDFHRLYTDILTSYIEIHHNYFEEIEDSARNLTVEKTEASLKRYLRSEYSSDAELFNPDRNPSLKNIKTVFKSDKVLINRNLNYNQRLFYVAKEVGYKRLNLKKRFLTSPNIKSKDLESYLNDYFASYFAAAFLIPEDEIAEKLKKLFSNTTFSASEFYKMADHFKVNIETLFYRLLTVLHKSFGLSDLYFLKFESSNDAREARILKEIKINNHRPYGVNYLESHCRRWQALSIFNDKLTERKIKTQISDFVDEEDRYFEISTIQEQINGKKETLTLCIGINKDSSHQIQFLNNKNNKRILVGHTCETCPIFDCKERVAAPTALTKERNILEIEKAVKSL